MVGFTCGALPVCSGMRDARVLRRAGSTGAFGARLSLRPLFQRDNETAKPGRPSRARLAASGSLRMLKMAAAPDDGGKQWWTHKGSNLGPLPCEGNALPLSYASGICQQNQGSDRVDRAKAVASSPAIYEVEGSRCQAKPASLTRPAGGRGRHGPAARGCARRACRCRRRLARSRSNHWPGAARRSGRWRDRRPKSPRSPNSALRAASQAWPLRRRYR